MKPNRNYRDSVFKKYFSDKEKLLELYNAIEGTNYGMDSDVEINTLDGVLFMDRENDISFTIDGKFVILMEHQTTVNQNMPLRCLIYIARLYEKITERDATYREHLLGIPTPDFIVLYNGKKDQPEQQILKLSDAFVNKQIKKLELEVKVVNINYGKSKILDKSKNLKDYSFFIYGIQKRINEGQELKTAITEAVKECINNNVLKKFLESNSSEVINMLYDSFDINVAKEVWQEEAREEGKLEERRQLAKSFLDVLDIKTISDKTGLSIDEIRTL